MTAHQHSPFADGRLDFIKANHDRTQYEPLVKNAISLLQTHVPRCFNDEFIEKIARDTVEKEFRDAEVWVSSLYQVAIYWNHVRDQESGWPDMHWLSIKRRDKAPSHDWRDLQEIKNVLIGSDHEGVELYPAERRLVDTANQYHLYVLADDSKQFPFGWQTRMVDFDSNKPGALHRQRPEGPRGKRL